MSGPSVLRAVGVSKAFPGIQALSDVDFEFPTGAVTGLIGPNGAGKSTLIGVLTGRHRPDSGHLELDGEELALHSERDAARAGIQVVPQELCVGAGLTVAENLLMGSYPGRAGMLDRARMRARASEIAARVGLACDCDTPIDQLSPVDMRLVMIGRAIGRDCRLMILDEPTASLSPKEVRTLIGLIGDLTAEGIGILYVSHRLSEIKELCETVAVLRDGRRVFRGPMAELGVDDLVAFMGSGEDGELPPRETAGPVGDAVALRAEGVSGGPVRDVSLTLRHGEILGVGGLVGAGRTELLELLAGAAPVEQGEVYWGDSPAAGGGLGAALASGVVFLPEDRRNLGGFQDLSVGENVSLPSMGRFRGLGGTVRRARERAAVAASMERVQAPVARIGEPLRVLSGGNQQKVLIAKWLLTEPTVFLFDEPTAGIDVHAKEEIREQIRELARSGVAVIVVSSDNEEFPGLCHRVLVMAEGRVTGEVSGADITPGAILRLSYGGQFEPPPEDAVIG